MIHDVVTRSDKVIIRHKKQIPVLRPARAMHHCGPSGGPTDIQQDTTFPTRVYQHARIIQSRPVCRKSLQTYRTINHVHLTNNQTNYVTDTWRPPLWRRRLRSRVRRKRAVRRNRKNSNVPRNERLCTVCDEGVLGHEIHFLYECTKLDDLKLNIYLHVIGWVQMYTILLVCYRTVNQTKLIIWQNSSCMA